MKRTENLLTGALFAVIVLCYVFACIGGISE